VQHVGGEGSLTGGTGGGDRVEELKDRMDWREALRLEMKLKGRGCNCGVEADLRERGG
jgi:hypothetical protein